MKYFSFSLLLATPFAIAANLNDICNSQTFLKSGLNVKQFQQCQEHIQNCPKMGPLPVLACVNKVVATLAVCKQTQLLAAKLQNSAAAFKAREYGKLILITETFVADGNKQYFIVTPQGCLINTVYSKKYAVAPNLINNVSPPSYQQFDRNRMGFNVPLVVTKGCLSCPVVANTVTKFQFDTNGNLRNVQE